jgi:uncharacterized coiled-coil DUF342 family protein
MIKNIIMNILVPIIAIGGVGMAIYSSMMIDDRVTENMRIADSLRAEVNKYHHQYDSLLVVANKLDSEIAEQENKIDSLKKRPPVIKTTPQINNADSAVHFLKDFIKE